MTAVLLRASCVPELPPRPELEPREDQEPGEPEEQYVNEYTPAVLMLGPDEVGDDDELAWDTELGPEKIAPAKDHTL